MMDQLHEYWSGLEKRERQMLMVGGVALSLTLVFLLVIEPLVHYRNSLEANVERKRETIAWMQSASRELARQPGNRPSAAVDTGSLLTLVDSSARNALLGDAIKRVQQNGEEAVRVRFEAAAFDDLLLWLGGLQQQFGVRIEDFTLERNDLPGRVDASITLSRAAG